MVPGRTSAANTQRTRLWITVLPLVGIVGLALLSFFWTRRLSSETERINQEIAVREAAPVKNQKDDRPPRTQAAPNLQNTQTALQAAQYALVAGQLTQAEQLAMAAVQRQPKDPDALIFLADIERNANHYDRAMLHYRAARAIAPKDVRAIAGLSYLYIAFGWPLEEKALLEPALRAAPQDSTLKVPLALATIQESDFAEAERLLQEVRRQAPDQPTLWSALPRLYNETKRHTEALALADEALSKTSEREATVILYDKGVAQYQLNDYPGAYATFDRVLANQPDNLFARNYLGQCLEQMGHHQEAMQTFEAVLRAAPNFQHTRLALGRLYLQSNRAAQGQKLLTEYRQGQAREQKREKLAHLVATQPDSAEAHWQMALLYREERNTPRMIVELSKTLELEPDNAEARHLLKTAEY